MIIPSHIICPHCGHIHVDRDEWATKPHKTHLCTEHDGGCGRLFRLEDPTNPDLYFAGVYNFD